MVIFGYCLGLVQNALHGKPSERSAARMIDHCHIFNIPVGCTPRRAGKARVLPVGMAVHDVEIRKDVRRAAPDDCPKNKRLAAERVFNEASHRRPIVRLCFRQKAEPVLARE